MSNNVVDFKSNDETYKESEEVIIAVEDNETTQKEQIKIIDGWDTNVSSEVKQTITHIDESQDEYRLNKSNRVIVPFNQDVITTIRYTFDTIIGLTVDLTVDILFAEDKKYNDCTVMWISDNSEGGIKSIIKYVNWKKILSNGGSLSAITDRKHILSFSADEETQTELVEIYLESVINGVNNDNCCIDVNVYAKLTDAGKNFLRG